MNENKNSQSQKPPKRHRIIRPSFYIDDKNRVICESHSQIERILTLTSLAEVPAFEETHQLENIITCKTCAHYRNDVCYFSKEDINKIEKDRLSYSYHCNLCGQSIDRPLTIMHSLYNKTKFNVDIPTVCCTCYSSLEKDSYQDHSRQKMITTIIKLIFFAIIQFLSVLGIRYIFAFAGGLYLGIMLFVTIFLGCSYIVFQDSRNLMFLIRGRKYYKKTFGKIKKREEGDYIDDFPFN